MALTKLISQRVNKCSSAIRGSLIRKITEVWSTHHQARVKVSCAHRNKGLITHSFYTSGQCNGRQTCTDRSSCFNFTHQLQFRLQYLAQGHLKLHTGGTRGRLSPHQVVQGQPEPTDEPQLSIILSHKDSCWLLYNNWILTGQQCDLLLWYWEWWADRISQISFILWPPEILWLSDFCTLWYIQFARLKWRAPSKACERVQQQTSNQFNAKIFIFSTTAVCCFFQRGCLCVKKSSCCCLLCSSVTAAHIRPKQLVAFNSVVPLHCSPAALHCCVCCRFVIIYCCFSLILTFSSVPLFQLIMFDTFFFSSQVLFTSFSLFCCWTLVWT